MMNGKFLRLMIFNVVLFKVACLSSLQLYAEESALNQQTKIKQGSRLKAMFNRSDLRDYAQKIRSGEITEQEIRDYIVKGGSLDQHVLYDGMKNFFVGAPQYSLLNFFIKRRFELDQPLAENRLEILSILLSAGANPNFNIESAGITKSANLAPILQSCSSNDLEALKLLYKHDGNIELTEDTYARTAGPCIAEAQSVEVLDWLLAAGANIDYIDEYDQTLLDLAVTRYDSNEKVKWLINQGVSPKIGSSGIDKLIERVNYSLAEHKKNLKSAIDNSKSFEGPQDAITIQQEQIDKREELLTILSPE